MSTGKTGTRYDEDFKRTLVNLYQSGGKTQAALWKMVLPLHCNEFIFTQSHRLEHFCKT